VISVLPGAVFNIGTASLSWNLNRTLNNSGTVNIIGGAASLNNASLNNLAGGVINCIGSTNFFNNLTVGGTLSAFTNGGTLNFNLPAGGSLPTTAGITAPLASTTAIAMRFQGVA
jgi:hypothetical protein